MQSTRHDVPEIHYKAYKKRVGFLQRSNFTDKAQKTSVRKIHTFRKKLKNSVCSFGEANRNKPSNKGISINRTIYKSRAKVCKQGTQDKKENTANTPLLHEN